MIHTYAEFLFEGAAIGRATSKRKGEIVSGELTLP